MAGASGAQGASGKDGAVGATGLQGPVGLTGAQGAVGANGAKVSRAFKVFQELPASRVPRDRPECRVHAGADGRNGFDGVQGAPGLQGPQGAPGQSIVGPQGAKGETGPAGAVGPAGPGWFGRNWCDQRRAILRRSRLIPGRNRQFQCGYGHVYNGNGDRRWVYDRGSPDGCALRYAGLMSENKRITNNGWTVAYQVTCREADHGNPLRLHTVRVLRLRD